MGVHLEPDVAGECVNVCGLFVGSVAPLLRSDEFGMQSTAPNAFDTARQISTVYSLFVGEDLRTLLNGFIDQAKAMSMLFAAAGGLIEAQDEAVAAALGKAAQEPAGLQSLGLMGSLGSTLAMVDAADGLSAPRGYDRVGPEEVSGAPLARLVSGAQALDPAQFHGVRDRVSTVATSLHTAADNLRSGLGNALGSQWQGEFATQASTSVGSFTESVDRLATVLEVVASKASIAEDGFSTTKTRIGEESVSLQAAQVNTPGYGGVYGPPTLDSAAAMAAAQAAAEEQARAIVNTVYSPAVMDANLADLDIPSPYRVVSTSALGGTNGIDLLSAWNVDAVVRPASPAVPGQAALAAAGGGGGAPAGVGAGGGAAGPGASPFTATDAHTEQAFLASRASSVDGGGPLVGAAGQASATGATAIGTHAGGVNASTHAAAAPFAPVVGANGQPIGAGGGAAGARGIRNGTTRRDRGYGSAAGVLGGSGAAAAGAGAGAARMGGAGTLAGFGTPGGPGTGGPGVGGPVTGAPGAGGMAAGSGSAGAPAGAFSSSNGGAQASRAGMMPMGMMGAAGAGQNEGRRGHTPAGYLTNATNTSEIIGEPVKVAPAVLGRTPPPDDAAEQEQQQKQRQETAYVGRVVGKPSAGS